MKEMDEFLKKFNFKKDGEGLIGIERERFLVDGTGRIVPRAADFLGAIQDPKWTYELSACQVEDRTTPQRELQELRRELQENDRKGFLTVEELGLRLRSIEVGPEDMPLDVYPNPRYLQIVKNISQERLRAACRVIGTHIHLGMPDIETAISTANRLANYLGYLCRLGDHSDGERLRLYKTMAIDWEPSYYRDVGHFFEFMKTKGWADNPRNCWHLIRVSIHGTVELRMFGTTDDIEKIISWVSAVREIIGGEKP